MKRIALMLAGLVAPAVLTLVLGSLVGCDNDHRRYRAERDRGPERRDVVIIDRDRHEDRRDGDRR
ncbi:MAG: hypothetical protein PHU85_11660 [Phycisphaerae bacterium]|nr:hypothetical protein [Phycisphaerae bacterium]